MRITKLAMIGCLMAVMSACSSFQPKSDIEAVKDRAQDRMDAMLAKDMESAYAFMSPGYRNTHALSLFVSSLGGGANRLVSAEAREARCDEDACTVFVYAQYRYGSATATDKDAGAYERTNEEKWIKVDGKWWFVSLS
ncbi:MAG: hypothetical protein V4812_00060 [Pseudomonadota bacterium]